MARRKYKIGFCKRRVKFQWEYWGVDAFPKLQRSVRSSSATKFHFDIVKFRRFANRLYLIEKEVQLESPVVKEKDRVEEQVERQFLTYNLAKSNMNLSIYISIWGYPPHSTWQFTSKYVRMFPVRWIEVGVHNNKNTYPPKWAASELKTCKSSANV